MIHNALKHFDEFQFGTQYYRAPTPLAEEWAGDLEHISAMGFDCIQIRILWRQNERVKDQYDFSDVDQLVELARKNHLKIVIKFLLENAPDYVFREYHGAPVTPEGLTMDVNGNGAFYLGGHRPCFDNPDVLARAALFVRKTVERYRNEPSLILWNVWNEPRIRAGECACPHSRAAYHRYLAERFGTVENLNAFLGKAWDSFEAVEPPQNFRTYADLFLWRQWSHTTLNGWLAAIRNAVQSVDTTHPVIAHVGCCNLVNDPVDDLTDDYANARLFDFYGTSLSVGERFDTDFQRSYPFLITARLFDCSPYFWVHELYPEWGDWCGHIPTADFRYKVMCAVAGGAKGLMLWQYRAERLGHENDLAGLVNIDGTPKAVTHECEKLISEIKPLAAFLGKAEPVTAPVGILFDLPSDLIGSVEHRTWDSKLRYAHGGVQPYMDAIQGINTIFYQLKIVPQIIDSRHLAEKIDNLKVLYLPECFIVTDEIAGLLQKFAARGGRLIAEEGLALRRPNTWLHYPWPGNGMDELFGVRLTERVDADKALHPWALADSDAKFPIAGYAAAVETLTPDTEVLRRWSDGRAAVTRKGECFYVGFSPGCWTLYSQCENGPDGGRGKAARELVRSLLADRIAFPDWPEPVMVRTLRAGDTVHHVVFNRAPEPVTFTLDGREITIAGRDSRIF